MNKVKNTLFTFIVTILVGGFTFLGYISNEKFENPEEIYQVYLDGEKMGLIKSKDDLYELINKEQKEIKKEYDVDQVYPPKGFKIVKKATYADEVSSVEKVYKDIKEKKQFTIKGYTVTVKSPLSGVEPQYLYIMDTTVLEEALKAVVGTFVGEERYEQYTTNTQPEVKETGLVIESMYFDEKITVKESYISVDETIYTESKDLTTYLLFGKKASYKEYKVKKGDTIESIAEENGINANALLMVNDNLHNEDTLLAIGQKVNVAAITPVLSLVYDGVLTEDQTSMYETKYVNDPSMYEGKTKVKTKGVKGINRVTSAVRVTNGQLSEETKNLETKVIKAAQTEIILKGTKKRPVNIGHQNPVIITGSWAWPTNKGYVITSKYGNRYLGGKWQFHDGIDISGTGRNSPIYAIQDGVVACSGYDRSGKAPCRTGRSGQVIIIKHANGYYSIYAHLVKGSQRVKTGDTVKKGQVIGGMGMTGWATGVHLHLGVWYGGYPYNGGKHINPLKLYR